MLLPTCDFDERVFEAFMGHGFVYAEKVVKK